MRLSIILPVYSETNSLVETIRKIQQVVPAACLHEVILIVCPQSVPESIAVCERLSKELVFVRCQMQQRNPGIGWAIRQGLDVVNGSHVILMACDGETDPCAIPLMIQKMEQTHCDIVCANRWSKKGGFVRYGFLKRMLNFLFQWMLKLLFHSGIDDYTYAYRLYARQTLEGHQWMETGFPFLLEVLLKPLKKGVKVQQVAVEWRLRTEGQSKNSFGQMALYLRTAFRIYFQK